MDNTPQGLLLEQVYVLSRHGERTPVRTRLTGYIPARWNMCLTGRTFQASVLERTPAASPTAATAADAASSSAAAGSGSSLTSLFSSSGKTGDAGDGTQIGALKVERRVEQPGNGTEGVGKGQRGDCMLGELTDIGRATTLSLGERLRKQYIEDIDFLPANPSSATTFFRSTNMPRTLESLQQVITGLYPAPARGEWIPKVFIRNPSDETLLPNTFTCARLRQLDREFAIKAARDWNKELEPLDAKLSKFIGARPIRVDGKPRLSGIEDTIRAAEANGVPVPEEFKDKDMRRTIERAICAEWFASYSHPEVRRLALGRSLSDINTSFQFKAKHSSSSTAAVTNDDPPPPTANAALKLAVLSVHDTSLAGVLATLDVFDDRWPGFTSFIEFQLLRHEVGEGVKTGLVGTVKGMLGGKTAVKPEQHYVRMKYNGKALALPACSGKDEHFTDRPELCTLTAFSEAIRRVTPKDWAAECGNVEGDGH